MKYKQSLVCFLCFMMPNFVFCEQWSTDDWGQWVSEDMSDQQFTNETFNQLNKLDGVPKQTSTETHTSTTTIPNDILFELWQLENGHQFVDIDQLNENDKILYLKWLAQSNLANDISTETVPELSPTYIQDSENNIPTPFTHSPLPNNTPKPNEAEKKIKLSPKFQNFKKTTIVNENDTQKSTIHLQILINTNKEGL
ncbi:hypothetical protein [Marinicellulosiphila megalodicopiae]|uniref:hypothetical protein n=1 Tax=Marinicellulosiphila megalodicopiae TaxID=2724896 RepID=UPI003BAEB547